VTVGAVLTTLIVGLELESRSRAPAPAAARAMSSTSRKLVVLGVAAALLAGLAVADSRPALNRAAGIDNRALARQLVAQFTLELSDQGYLYVLSASCNGTTPDGLQYLCLVQTTEPVGKTDKKVLYWNVTVACDPNAGDAPRCITNQGEALN
jgi:hypothetical protein